MTSATYQVTVAELAIGGMTCASCASADCANTIKQVANRRRVPAIIFPRQRDIVKS